MEHGSSYQHYEDRYRKPLLPLDLTQKLVPIFARAGADPAELYALAGVDASGSHLLNVKSAADEEAAGRIIRIEELDVRASAGAGLTGEDERVVTPGDSNGDNPCLFDGAVGGSSHHYRDGRQHGAGAATGSAYSRRYRRPKTQSARNFCRVGRFRDWW